MQRADILHRLFPAVFLAEKAEMRLVRRALSVAELVVQHHDVAVFGEKRGKRVVPGDMLGDAVNELDDGLRLPFRLPERAVQTACAAGIEIKFFH